MKTPPRNAARSNKSITETTGSLVSTTIKNAQGKWPHILSTLGINVPDTPNKHGPCPVCEGTDRFRFDDKEGKGTWFCNQCTPQSGDGLNLVCNVLNLTPIQAAKRVNELFSLNPEVMKSSSIQPSKTNKEMERETKREAKKILKETKLGKSFYLVSKNLEGIESLILNRSLPNLGLFNSPLLVIPFEKNGQLATLQFIDKKGNKRFLKGTGTQTRSYHQIPGKTDDIYIGEGYATTLTSTRLTGSMGYVAGSANNIPSVALIASHHHPMSKIIILIDNDPAGIKSLKKVITLVPNGIGITPSENNEKTKDWNDYYQIHGKEKTKKDLKQAIQKKNYSMSVPIENDVVEICRQLEKTSYNDLMNKSETIALSVNIINKNHCIVLAGSTVTIIRSDNNNIKFLSIKAFRDWGVNLKIPYVNDKGERKIISAIKSWENSPNRRAYDDVIFHPIITNPKKYNLWRGFNVKSEYVKNWPLCEKFLIHLLDNICDGNKKNYHYLLSWIANIFQHPEEKPGVALVMRSEGRGTGKSKVAEVLTKLIGFHSVKVSNLKHLTGNFNAHLSSAILTTVEESFWTGNKTDAGILQDMITSETMTMERKFADVIELKSFHRIIMITNHDWAVPASHDERRYFVLDVGEHQKQNRAYFKSLTEDLEAGGYGQLMDYLINYDYSNVDIGEVPRTKGLEKQIIESLSDEASFWCECLLNGAIENFELNKTNETEVAKRFVYKKYLEYLKLKNIKTVAANDISFGKKIKKMCPSVNTIKTKNLSHLLNSRVNGYKLPSLEICRQEFEAAFDISIEWN